MKTMRIILAAAVLLLGLCVGLVGQQSGDLAEIRVSQIVLDPPSTVTHGDEVEIHARIMNTGGRNASDFEVSAYYRPLREGERWLLLQTLTDVDVVASQQGYIELTFTMATTDLELGTYEIRVVADSANQISEVDELNNSLQTTLTVVASASGMPDLQPISLSYEPINPGTADDTLPWNVSAEVENTGDADAGPFSVVFLVDGQEFDRKFLFVLPVGGSSTLVGELDPYELSLGPGTYEITVQVDPENQADEQDEANNSITGSLTLQSPELHPTGLSFDKSVVRLDEEVRVSVGVANSGEGTAKDVEVSFFVGETRFATSKVALLGQGQEVTVTGLLDPEKLGLSPSVYPIRVVIDPRNLLQELDEANNEMVRSMTILEPAPKRAELHPESVELSPASPAELGRTDTITLSSTVSNTGRSAAEGFSITFSYRVKGGVRWTPIACSGTGGCQDLSLASGGQSTWVAVLPISALLPGIYEVRVLVDSEDSISELDETNNEMQTTLTILASRQPDLTFCAQSPLQFEPGATVTHGQTVRPTVCISNLGELASGPFTVRFGWCRVGEGLSVDDSYCLVSDDYATSGFTSSGEQRITGLDVGESVEIPVLLETRNLDPGQYNLRVVIDVANDVKERNESNNEFVAQLNVLGPDLLVAGFEVSPPNSVDQGQLVNVAATIYNLGVEPAGAFTVLFKLLQYAADGTEIVRLCGCAGEILTTTCQPPDDFGRSPFSGLDVQAAVRATCTLDTSNVEPGDYIVRAEIQTARAFADYPQINNYAEIPLTVQLGPDLAVQGVETTADDGAVAGPSLDVIATLDNLGGRSAAAFDTTIELLTPDGAACGEDEECPEAVASCVVRTPGLSAGGEAPVECVLDVSSIPPGDYVLRVTADSAEVIAEPSEANNVAELPIRILGGGAQPQVAADLRFTQDIGVTKVDLADGTFQLYVRVANSGPEVTGSFDVLFSVYIDPQGPPVQTSATIPGLADNGHAIAYAVFSVPNLVAGTYHAVAVLDPTHRITEIDEEDNVRTTEISLQE
jgi:subtilase family serine protease